VANIIPVILAEDESLFRDLLYKALSQMTGIRIVGTYADGNGVLECDQEFSVAVLDIELGRGPNGIQTGLLLRRTKPRVGIVILSQHDSAQWLPLIPLADRPGWAYLRKSDVQDTRTILRAIQGVALGRDLLDEPIEPKLRGPVASLTTRQLEILRLIAFGYSNLEIGHQLRLAPKSVEHAINRVYRALHIATDTNWLHPRVEAARQYWDATRSDEADLIQDRTISP